MALSILGIVINIILVIAIVVVIIAIFALRAYLDTCENKQSPYCYSVVCPCDEQAPPCFGYTKAPGPRQNTWYCSDAPLTLVDNEGNVLPV